jgi:predicted DNA-binding protein (UPF0251 family)
MPRPFKFRNVNGSFPVNYYKPAGIPLGALEEVVLGVDEMEAIRLADAEGMYQADAAEKMGVSRQTFGNIIKAAHQKIADALINGKAIRIEGGIVNLENQDIPPFPGGMGRGQGRGGRGRGFQGGNRGRQA